MKVVTADLVGNIEATLNDVEIQFIFVDDGLPASLTFFDCCVQLRHILSLFHLFPRRRLIVCGGCLKHSLPLVMLSFSRCFSPFGTANIAKPTKSRSRGGGTKIAGARPGG